MWVLLLAHPALLSNHPDLRSAAAIKFDELAEFAFELGVLKRIRRAGWWHVGVRDPESVGEHSLRVAQLASPGAVADPPPSPARWGFLCRQPAVAVVAAEALSIRLGRPVSIDLPLECPGRATGRP